jgi:hypothetical protein
MNLRSLKSQLHPLSGNHKYLDINPEGALLRESQDIAEELGIMLRIYNQQLNVVKDFRKALVHMNGEHEEKGKEAKAIAKLLLAVRQNLHVGSPGDEEAHQNDIVPQHSIQEAEDLIDHVASRKAEIWDLEVAALDTSRQVGVTDLPCSRKTEC